MIALLAVSAAFLTVGLFLLSQAIIRVGPWQVRHPTATLLAWQVTVVAAGAVLSATAGATVALAVSPADVLADADATATTVGAWAALLIFGGATASLLTHVESLRGAEADNVRALLRTSHRVSVTDDFGRVLVVEDDHPSAFALYGSARDVAITRGMLAILTESELRAVIAHERAHLRGSHDIALRMASTLSALPQWLGTGRVRRNVELLIELAADDAACAAAGAVHLANALVRVSRATGSPSMLLRAERLEGFLFGPPRSSSRLIPERVPSSPHGERE